MEDTSFDTNFEHIASQQKGIQSLLLAFFGFLKRRTDFYVTYPECTESLTGFLPGISEAMVLKAFRSYPFRQAGIFLYE